MTDIEARLWALEHLAAVTVRESTSPAGIQATIDRLKAIQVQNEAIPEGWAPRAPPEVIPHLLAIFARALEQKSLDTPAGNA